MKHQVRGVVTHLTPPQLSPPSRMPFSFGRMVLRGSGVLLMGAFAIASAGIALVLDITKSLAGGKEHVRSSGHGFVKSVLIRVTGFLFTGRLLAAPQLRPVIHFRIRDMSTCEHSVRVEGHLRGAGIALGDDLSVCGDLRAGTWHMQRGWNHRLNAEIEVSPD
jgi:hypothetical protein